MLLQAQRVSVFTFQSAVHSAHVLQCLDEQRRRDVLCDVTVVVEGRSFRAHAAVLASCSEYFHGCVAVADSKHNAVVALPDEVTVRGFEPLLQFAYTSKLLFTKENIHEIQSCAKFLGFRNLESGCFDFLIPKFCEPEAQDVKRKRCCQGAEAKPPRSCHLPSEPPAPFPSGAPAPTRDLCLETCGPQMSSLSPDLAADVVCPMLSLADPAKAGQASQLCAGGDVLASDDVCAQSRSGLPELPCELSAAEPVDPLDGMRPGEGLEEDCGLVSCPGARLLERAAEDEGFSERSKDEREVAEHLAKGFWSDLYAPAQAAPPSDRSDLEKSPSDFHWLKQLDLTSNPADCPFLRELGSADESNPCADAPSQSEKSPCISSLNSGDDSDDVDTDGDTEANNRRAAEIQLPFPVEHISALSRSAFQQLLKHHSMTPEQLDFVHDVRRRSKNRAAAQRCRKRKMDSIHHLDGDIKTLKSEREKLLQERAELEQNLEETRQSLCRLCKSVSAEPASDQDRLHFLAKLSAPDSPASPQKDA